VGGILGQRSSRLGLDCRAPFLPMQRQPFLARDHIIRDTHEPKSCTRWLLTYFLPLGLNLRRDTLAQTYSAWTVLAGHSQPHQLGDLAPLSGFARTMKKVLKTQTAGKPNATAANYCLRAIEEGQGLSTICFRCRACSIFIRHDFTRMGRLYLLPSSTAESTSTTSARD
jgi:hypothetical protein